MTIEKFISFVVSCDECAETFDTDETEFGAALDALKKEGWKPVCHEGTWNHICPSCVEDENALEDI